MRPLLPLTLLPELRSGLRVSAARKPVVLDLLKGARCPLLPEDGQFTPPRTRSRALASTTAVVPPAVVLIIRRYNLSAATLNSHHRASVNSALFKWDSRPGGGGKSGGSGGSLSCWTPRPAIFAASCKNRRNL